MIKKTIIDDREKLLSIIENSGQFDDDSLEHVRQTLDEHLSNPDQALWYTAHDHCPVGVAYCIPEPVTSGTWNLLMLWVEAGFEGKGFGSALVARIESDLLEKGARLLIVETSGLDEFEIARSFYEKSGFQLEARIKNFFDVGDDKLVYTKSL